MSFTTFITPAELEMNLNDPDWVIVDCRFDLMKPDWGYACLLYTSDAADDLLCVDLGGRRIIKKKNTTKSIA